MDLTIFREKRAKGWNKLFQQQLYCSKEAGNELSNSPFFEI